MLGEEVDMVGNHHQVANLESRIHATGSDRDEERLDAQFVHHANGEGHLLHVVALVVVETALHSHDVHTAKLAEDQCSGVSLNGRNGEVGNILIRNLQFVSYFVS